MRLIVTRVPRLDRRRRPFVQDPAGPVKRRRRDRPLDRDVPEGEPPLELRLHGQLGADLRPEPQLALVVALLVPWGGDERIERAPLVVVDPVASLAAGILEGEDRAQDALAVPTGLQGARD